MQLGPGAIVRLLLNRTIAHAAARVPAYAPLAPLVERIVERADLRQLPIVEKSAMIERPDDFRDPALRATFLQHTSGTEGGALIMQRCAEEIGFRTRFFSAVNSGAAGPDDSLPIILHVESAFGSGHGVPMPSVYHGPVFRFALNDWLWARHAADIVSRPWEYACCEPGTVAVAGLEPGLRALTALLLERDFDFAATRVSGLFSTGDLVTSFRRSWYERIWHAPFIDRYSMSEILAGADTCASCGLMHFEPSIVAEAVDPFTREPVNHGLAVLVLTTLYPFIQKQPMIRYWSGDLVEADDACDDPRIGFRLVGRLRDCVVAAQPAGTALLLGSNALYELLERRPETAFSRDQDPMWMLRNPGAVGYPKCAVTADVAGGVHRISIELEVGYDRYLHPEYDAAFVERLRADLFTAHPALSRAVDERRAELAVTTRSHEVISRLRPGKVF